MTDHPELSRKLDRISLLLTLNLAAFVLTALLVVGGLLPILLKVSRTTVRVEQRFQDFADEVQPVVSAGAGKAIETITGIDAGRLSDTATESSDQLIRSAGERAKRYLERKKNSD